MDFDDASHTDCRPFEVVDPDRKSSLGQEVVDHRGTGRRDRFEFGNLGQQCRFQDIVFFEESVLFRIYRYPFSLGLDLILAGNEAAPDGCETDGLAGLGTGFGLHAKSVLHERFEVHSSLWL